MADETIRVGFVGAGQMGRPMVDRMVAGGCAVTVYARRAGHRAELEEAGIAVTDSVADLAAKTNLVIVCLFSDDQAKALFYDEGLLAALTPGSILASHVTGSPELSTQLAADAPTGVTILDAPISGTADTIAAGQLTILLGGDEASIARAKPALATYASTILSVGRLGDGQRMKLINNLLFTVNLKAALDAVALGEQMGIDPSDLARVLTPCSGDSFALRLMEHMPPSAMSDGARPYLIKDVSAIQAVATEAGLDLGQLGDLAAWVFEGAEDQAIPEGH